eukprot:TRINITY_DN11686_c3_g1_i1.p1 TRINITY_DN11686_c3_g1~~TRINITY_DN11686_c3_g1_i1.p1  ORF type:complete len:569 (+),score=154.09 TRINITY_DN11686_c3_g1_i1:54-1709(+)
MATPTWAVAAIAVIAVAFCLLTAALLWFMLRRKQPQPAAAPAAPGERRPVPSSPSSDDFDSPLPTEPEREGTGGESHPLDDSYSAAAEARILSDLGVGPPTWQKRPAVGTDVLVRHSDDPSVAGCRGVVVDYSTAGEALVRLADGRVANVPVPALSWRRVIPPAGTAVRCVAATSADDAWLVGQEGRAVGVTDPAQHDQNPIVTGLGVHRGYRAVVVDFPGAGVSGVAMQPWQLSWARSEWAFTSNPPAPEELSPLAAPVAGAPPPQQQPAPQLSVPRSAALPPLHGSEAAASLIAASPIREPGYEKWILRAPRSVALGLDGMLLRGAPSLNAPVWGRCSCGCVIEAASLPPRKKTLVVSLAGSEASPARPRWPDSPRRTDSIPPAVTTVEEEEHWLSLRGGGFVLREWQRMTWHRLSDSAARPVPKRAAQNSEPPQSTRSAATFVSGSLTRASRLAARVQPSPVRSMAGRRQGSATRAPSPPHRRGVSGGVQPAVHEPEPSPGRTSRAQSPDWPTAASPTRRVDGRALGARIAAAQRLPPRPPLGASPSR